MRSRGVGVKDSNEAALLATLLALWFFSRSFQVCLILESDSHNAILWVSNVMVKALLSRCHLERSANGWADSSAKPWVNRSSPREVLL